MERREMVLRLGTLVLALPAGHLLAACGGDDSGSGAQADALTFTSSVDDGHRHTVTIERASLTDSPPAGVQRVTSSDTGHNHVVVLTEADLDTINAGQTVTRQSTEDDGHSHTFVFRTG
jgi:hypothetical protein